MIAALVRMREIPFRALLAKMDKLPFGVPGIGAGSEPKKPFRRCFKPRRQWRAGYAGFASGCLWSREHRK